MQYEEQEHGPSVGSGEDSLGPTARRHTTRAVASELPARKESRRLLLLELWLRAIMMALYIGGVFNLMNFLLLRL